MPVIISLVFGVWFYAGWPPIWLAVAEVQIPEDVSTTPAAETTSIALPTWQPDSTPASGVAVQVKEDGEAKIDLSTLNFSPPPGAGELELYALPDRCLGTLSEIKRNLMTYPYCGDPIGFAVFRPQDYSWKINVDERVVLGFCQDADRVDCGDHPEAFKIVFISDEVLRPGVAPGNYSLTLPR